jgi:hypothetical protein
MTNDAILAAIDEEITKLQQARAMLAGSSVGPAKKTVGRPKGSKKTSETAPSVKKRVLSEEARAKIAAAQKKRWTAHKKSAK